MAGAEDEPVVVSDSEEQEQENEEEQGVDEVDDLENGEEKEKNRGAFAPITSGVGFNLLKRMGWSEGKGCGSQEQGRSDPIWSAHKADSDGLCELCAFGECEIHGRKVSAMALAISLLPAKKKHEEEYVHHVKLTNKKISEAVKVNKSSTAEVEFEVNGKPKARRTRLAVKLHVDETVEQTVVAPAVVVEETPSVVVEDPNESFDLYDIATDVATPPVKRPGDEEALEGPSSKKGRASEPEIDYDALSSLLSAFDGNNNNQQSESNNDNEVTITGSSGDLNVLSSADLSSLLQVVVDSSSM